MPRTGKKSAKAKTRDKVRAYRERLRKQGLRPIQIWVPDVNSPEFKAEAYRQSVIIGNAPGEEADQAFVDAVSDLTDFWDGK